MTTMTRREATQILKAIRMSGAAVRTVRIGSGERQTIGLYGRQAEAMAVRLEAHGFRRGRLSGAGRDAMDVIEIGR